MDSYKLIYKTKKWNHAFEREKGGMHDEKDWGDKRGRENIVILFYFKNTFL